MDYIKELIESANVQKFADEQSERSKWNSRYAYMVDLRSNYPEDIKLLDLEGKKALKVIDQMIELMKLALDCNQYDRRCEDYSKVTRVVRIRINMSRESIKKYYGIDTVNLYGSGIYIPMEGMLMTPEFRTRSKYDVTGKHAIFDLREVPEEYIEDYDFRLTIPAGRSLFVPKKEPINSWFNSVRQLQYFDIFESEYNING